MAARLSAGKPGDLDWDRSGFTDPAGAFVPNMLNQRTFVPADLPPSLDYDRETIELLCRAESKVGELRGKADAMPGPHVFARAYLKTEAVSSSRIEGTSASLEDLNLHEATGGAGGDARLGEVISCASALDDALGKLEGGRRIDPGLIREAHRILMSGVRGWVKSPGQFRDGQNWIGKGGRIVYMPPDARFVPGLVDNLCGFTRIGGPVASVLVQCAVAHYQFEAIHPFFDGNGRVGRMLLALMLHEKGAMPLPLLHLSAYFEEHLGEYYGGLLSVSRTGSWNEWIAFFLRAFEERADRTIKGVQRLASIRGRYAGTLKKRNARGRAMSLMESLFANPYVTIPAARGVLNSSYPGAKSAVEALVQAGILKRADIQRRSKVFVAEEIEDCPA